MIRGVCVSLFDFSALWLAVITVYAVWSLLLRQVHVHLVIYSHYAFIYRRTVNNWNVSSSEILILVGQNCFDFDRLRTKWEKYFQNSSINYISWLYVKNENIIYSRRRIFRLSWNHTHATVSNVVPNLVCIQCTYTL